MIKSASDIVVLESAEPVPGRGSALYLDNWCSSSKLQLELYDSWTNALGTFNK